MILLFKNWKLSICIALWSRCNVMPFYNSFQREHHLCHTLIRVQRKCTYIALCIWLVLATTTQMLINLNRNIIVNIVINTTEQIFFTNKSKCEPFPKLTLMLKLIRSPFLNRCSNFTCILANAQFWLLISLFFRRWPVKSLIIRYYLKIYVETTSTISCMLHCVSHICEYYPRVSEEDLLALMQKKYPSRCWSNWGLACQSLWATTKVVTYLISQNMGGK